MANELVLEKWSGSVNTVNIGAGPPAGRLGKKVVSVGGEKTLAFLSSEAELPNPPKIAFEIWDTAPAEWPAELVSAYGLESLKNPLQWAERCVKEYNAELLCVKLQGIHPEFGNKSVDKTTDFLKRLAEITSVPLIILGCGDDAKDNLALPACSQALKGENCLFGCVSQDNYRTLTAAVMADGHNIIAESPIDVNIAKQLNILISDMGLPLERIVINPTIGALGYGLEYAYSIMERARLAGLAGDKTLASPFICFVGQEAWRVKEATISEKEMPGWGNAAERGIIWEIVTAVALLQAGADILVMRHPKAIEKVNGYIKLSAVSCQTE